MNKITRLVDFFMQDRLDPIHTWGCMQVLFPKKMNILRGIRF